MFRSANDNARNSGLPKVIGEATNVHVFEIQQTMFGKRAVPGRHPYDVGSNLPRFTPVLTTDQSNKMNNKCFNMNPVTLAELGNSKQAAEGVMENQKVWVADPTEGFVLGRIVDLGSDEVTVQPFDRKHKPVACSYDRVYFAEDDDNKDVADNCGLMYLNEATLLHNVRLRYMQDQIYTYVANILIAVNPYSDIKDLYSSKTIASYRGKSLGVLPPHVFAIADKAYRDMKVLKLSQSIIVSGESGAGKTESTKYILRYLCETGGHAAGPIEGRILDANPLLEAFGNAKTTRNNNSSRFGKFIEIHFSEKNTVVGGYISHYLLEKSRICGQSPEERNYHIFYQLCAGAPEGLRKQLKLAAPDQFHYLRQGCTAFFSQAAKGNKGALHDPLLDDTKDFTRMDKSLQSFNVTDQERMAIYSTVAAVLHLGNVNFEENPDDTRGGCRVAQGSEQALATAAGLIGVNAGELQQALLSRVMQAAKGGYKGTIIMVPLKPWEAANARDALAKAMYSKLFDYIVNRINQSIPFQSSAQYIGVLDIAGFEYFPVNSFEQFCINYCNEKLQMFFNERVLHDEQALYAKEGLNVPKIDYVDNQDCIALIETKSLGIIDLLNEEGKLPKPSAAHFTANVHSNYGQHFRLALPRRSKLKQHRELRDEEGFIIRHFAGAVCYQTAHFIDKNNDALHASLEALMSESRNPFLNSLFESSDMNLNKGKLAYTSVASKFRGQLDELMEKLHSTGTSFIRCIKPNVRMIAKEFEGGAILSQLQCAGMGSVLELMQQGYPSRTGFQSLYDMYKRYLPGNLVRLDPRMFCKALFHALGLDENDFKFGMTKVFFKAGKFAEFDQMLKADPENLAALVKKVHRWLLCSRWKKAQWGTLMVLKLTNKIKYRRENLVKVQKTVRMYQAKKQHRPRYLGITRIKDLKNNVSQMSRIVTQLKKNQEPSAKIVAQMDSNLNAAIKKIKTNPKITREEIEKDHASLVATLNKELAALKRELEKQKIAEEQERLKKIQEQMEQERKKKEDEERRRVEEEDNRKKKAEIEAKRKKAEQEAQQFELATKMSQTSLESVLAKEKADDSLARQQLEQERRDHELALRLAQEMGAPVDELGNIQSLSASNTPRVGRAQTGSKAAAGNTKKYDLSKWKYSELRDTINTSCDVALLEACREEFHRRLKVYHAWKAKNKKRNSVDDNERVPKAVLDAARHSKPGVNGIHSEAPDAGEPIQRFFRIPFVRPISGEGNSSAKMDFNVGTSGQKGWWFAHFDGQYIARQMELHDGKDPIFLVAGKDDMQMCELSLEETGLTMKRGAEILNHEFEKEWESHGGQPHVRPAERAKC